MSYPRFPSKYNEGALVRAEDYLKYLSQSGKPLPSCQSKLVVSLSPGLWQRHSKQLDNIQKFMGLRVGQLKTDPSISFAAGVGFGAPSVVARIEELIVFGAKQIILIGVAGALQPDIADGSLVICQSAVRDEGCSYHYVPDNEEAAANPLLVDALSVVLEQKKANYIQGNCWSTDAVYRETRSEVLGYQQQGILAVDMESAAAFTLALYREVRLASLLVISDSLAGGQWQPRFLDGRVGPGLDLALQASFEALKNTKDN